jgi:S-adenosylmethionine synthetase
VERVFYLLILKIKFMINEKIRTCEYVSPMHPDKICDRIADAILFAYLKKDKKSRVAVEVMGGHGVIDVSGEVTSKGEVDIWEIVKSIVGEGYKINVNITKQSQYIAQGVDNGGAGDQGIMVGYACNETKSLIPLEYELAKNLCLAIYKKYPYDGKTQVTINSKKVIAVVASFQNTKTPELEKLVKKLIKAEKYFINPAGEWPVGGFDSDSGLSGRKIVVDAYGPNVPVGGGSFAGKDLTKVDRSGALIAREIAVELLRKYKVKEVLVKLAYVIGLPQPVMAVAETNPGDRSAETIEINGRDLSPKGIMKALDLGKYKSSE